MSDLLPQYLGSLVGLAIGDALGTPVEFKQPGTFQPVTDFADSDRLKAGEWTDDTAMTLCLANSLIESGGFDRYDQMRKYQRWLNEGYCTSSGKAVGVGQTILRSLLAYEEGKDPYDCPVAHRHNDGNGSLMRIAPIALYFRNTPQKALEFAVKSSLITHRSQKAADACRYYTALILGALHGESKKTLLEGKYSPVEGYWEENPLDEAVDVVTDGSYKEKELPEIVSSGYVVESLEAALWAFHTTDSFEEGVLKAVNLGNDADTVGAIYGQLAGAYYGIDAIPEQWKSGIAKRGEIESVATGLF